MLVSSNIFKWALLPNTPWNKLTCTTWRMRLNILEIILSRITRSYWLTTFEIAREPKVPRGTSLYWVRGIGFEAKDTAGETGDRHGWGWGKRKIINVRTSRTLKCERIALPDSTHGLWCRICGLFSLHAFLAEKQTPTGSLRSINI